MFPSHDLVCTFHTPKGVAFNVDGNVKADANSGKLRVFASGSGTAMMEVGSSQIDAAATFRLGSSAFLQLEDSNHEINKNGSTVRVKAGGTNQLTVAAGGVTTAGTLTTNGLANLDAGIAVDTNKFTVSSAGAVSGAGNFQVGGDLALGTANQFGITRAGAVDCGVITATGLANLNNGIEVDNGGNKFTVSNLGGS